MNAPAQPVTESREASGVTTSAPLATVPAPSAVGGRNPAVALSAVPHGERVLASASYFSAFTGFWFVVPGVVYLWKGKESHFLGFHALQAVMLQVAVVPVAFAGIGLAYAFAALIGLIGSPAASIMGMIVFFTIFGLAVTVPMASFVWLGLCALRGQPRSLPLLGRWANAVLRDR